jgi:hypothetical protein
VTDLSRPLATTFCADSIHDLTLKQSTRGPGMMIFAPETSSIDTENKQGSAMYHPCTMDLAGRMRRPLILLDFFRHRMVHEETGNRTHKLLRLLAIPAE